MFKVSWVLKNFVYECWVRKTKNFEFVLCSKLKRSGEKKKKKPLNIKISYLKVFHVILKRFEIYKRDKASLNNWCYYVKPSTRVHRKQIMAIINASLIKKNCLHSSNSTKTFKKTYCIIFMWRRPGCFQIEKSHQNHSLMRIHKPNLIIHMLVLACFHVGGCEL